MPPPVRGRHGLLNPGRHCGSSNPIGPCDATPYSSLRTLNSRDFHMTQLARLVNLAAVLMAVAFFAAALAG